MNPLATLDQIRIATPCSMPWGQMKGDDRVRFCDACGKHVYNLAAIPTRESLELVQKAEGLPCLRLYRRRDGTIITADCPVGLREAAARRLRNLLRLAAMVTGIWSINAYLKASASWPYGSAGMLPAVPWLSRDGSERGACVVMGEMTPVMGTPAAPPAPGSPPLSVPAQSNQ